MKLTPMRYKDFTWPHNPEVYQVERRREMAVHKVPFGGCVLQDLGSTYRVLQGEGTFAGRDGLLVHPVWPAANAHFVSLELTEKPLPDYVRYRFAFWEDRGSYAAALTALDSGGEQAASADKTAEETSAVYTVRKGDTLWGIAKRYGVTLTALIAANPQIKNPNLIYPGDRVRIP